MMRVDEIMSQSIQGSYEHGVQQIHKEGHVEAHNGSNGQKTNEEKINLEESLKKLNHNAEIENKGIKFEKVDNDHNTWVVKVINESTGEIIRQIPSEEYVRRAQKLEEMMGSIFDKEG